MIRIHMGVERPDVIDDISTMLRSMTAKTEETIQALKDLRKRRNLSSEAKDYLDIARAQLIMRREKCVSGSEEIAELRAQLWARIPIDELTEVERRRGILELAYGE